LLPRENVGSGIAITSLTFNLARILGPALAGALITSVGVGYAFAFNALTYLGVIAALLSLKIPAQLNQGIDPRPIFSGLWTDIGEGVRYTFTHPILKWIMPMVAITATLTWPLNDLMAGISDQEFARGASGLAILSSAQGVGAIVGGLFLAQHGNKDLDWIFMAAMGGVGILVALFAITKIFWLAVPLLAVLGVFHIIVGVGSQTVAQTMAADHMRGRTLSVWYTITRFGPAMGALGLGILCQIFGFTFPILMAGSVTLAAAIMFIYKRRRAL
jgi:predicted MFS family arabinose efflux permease